MADDTPTFNFVENNFSVGYGAYGESETESWDENNLFTVKLV